MTKVIVFESHGTGFYHEAHAYDCNDVTKKLASWGLDRNTDGTVATSDTIEEAKARYEANNEQFEAEGGSGYYWSEHVKVYPCIKKVGA